MPLPGHDRKVLWGRSGGRCAFCRTELVINATPTDREAIVGAECHIIPQGEGGPDTYENILLLCGTHHTQVDNQPGEFPPERRREIKRDHEAWVDQQLTPKLAKEKTLRVLLLPRITTGSALMNLVGASLASNTHYDEPANAEESTQVGELLQLITDWREVWSEVPIAEQVRIQTDLSATLATLAEQGWYVFATSQRMVYRPPPSRCRCKYWSCGSPAQRTLPSLSLVSWPASSTHPSQFQLREGSANSRSHHSPTQQPVPGHPN